MDVLPPAIESAIGQCASVIRLTWIYTASPPATEFEFDRSNALHDDDKRTFKATTSPYDDNNDGLGLDDNAISIASGRLPATASTLSGIVI
jgi:hypothetical protein